MLTLDAVLHRTGLLFGDRTAFIEDHRTQSWREHIGRVGRIAGFLVRLGIGRGDKFAVFGKNSVRQAEISMRLIGLVRCPCRRRLAIVDALPRSAMGKVLKQELRRRIGGATREPVVLLQQG